MTRRPAVFLDRDGTLIEERGYPTREEDLVLLPGVGPALERLARAGYLRIVLTNQSAVARGLLSEQGLEKLHENLRKKLADAGGSVDAIYYCPHHPQGKAAGYALRCACRKPARGLLDLACAEHAIDLQRSCFVGDSPRDLFLSAAGTGARILLASGHPLTDTSGADQLAADLPAAVDWLLRGRGA